MAEFSANRKHVLAVVLISTCAAFTWLRLGATTLQSSINRSLPGGNCVAITADDNHVAVGTRGYHGQRLESVLTIRDTASFEEAQPDVIVSQWVTALEFVSEEVGFVAAISSEPKPWTGIPQPSVGRIELFSMSGVHHTIVDSITNPITSIAVSPNRKLLTICTGGEDGVPPVCQIRSLPSGAFLTSFTPVDAGVLSVTFSSNSQRCLVLRGRDTSIWKDKDQDVRAYLIDTTSTEVLQETQLDRKPTVIRDVCGSPIDSFVYIAIDNYVSRFEIDSDSFKYERFWGTYSEGIRNIIPTMLHYSSTNQLLVIGERRAGSHDGSFIRFVDVNSRRVLDDRIETVNMIHDFVISNDGDFLYLVGHERGRDGMIERYNLPISMATPK